MGCQQALQLFNIIHVDCAVILHCFSTVEEMSTSHNTDVFCVDNNFI